MNTSKVYISVSDEKGQLTIDGHLELLRQFLLTIVNRTSFNEYPETADESRPEKFYCEVNDVK